VAGLEATVILLPSARSWSSTKANHPQEWDAKPWVPMGSPGRRKDAVFDGSPSQEKPDPPLSGPVFTNQRPLSRSRSASSLRDNAKMEFTAGCATRTGELKVHGPKASRASGRRQGAVA